MKKTLLVGTIAVFFLLTLPLWIGTNKVLAMISNIPIQGKLTDAGGTPLNGTYSIKATIYNASSGGTVLCTDTHDVTVANGLFIMDMGGCISTDFGGLTQVYLGIQVGSDPEMTPRQPLYGVPFAWGLVNGRLASGASTYHFIPGSALIKEQSSDSTEWDLVYGGALIRRGLTAGNKTVRYPLTIPSVLYGQPVRVTGVTVYYKCQNGAVNYITGTYLTKNTDADSANYLINDTTDRTSNTATSYFLATDSAYNTLSSSQGILTLQLTLFFADNTNYVEVTGIRLTLDTNF
jgi:hypothetical protein